MIEGFDVFVVSLLYQKVWKVESFEITQEDCSLEMVFMHFFEDTM
jgi:hypothetical protein